MQICLHHLWLISHFAVSLSVAIYSLFSKIDESSWKVSKRKNSETFFGAVAILMLSIFTLIDKMPYLPLILDKLPHLPWTNIFVIWGEICLFILYSKLHSNFSDIQYHELIVTENESFCKEIESVQYNAPLVITNVIQGTSREKMYNELGLKTLKSRRWLKKLYCFYMI